MASSLRVVFAGTPEFAIPCLQACLDARGVQVVATYTQPDRQSGRGRRLSASPVKQAAQAAGIEVEQPATLKSPQAQERLAQYRPDLLVVVAYGLILPQAVLDLPRLGCWNVHASLLPRWRGAAPIQRAIAAGDAQTGICLMRMEAGLDTGPVLLQQRTAITDADTGGSLHDRLAALGAAVLAGALSHAVSGQSLTATPQQAADRTYAHKLSKAEAVLDLSAPAAELARKIRAFNPWPVAHLALNGENIRIWHAVALDEHHTEAPGHVLRANAEGIDIACGQGTLHIVELQRPGGRRMHAVDYLNAHPDLRTRAPS